MNVEEVIRELGTPRTVYVDSSDQLAQDVAKAADKIDQDLLDKERYVPDRKKMTPLPAREVPGSFTITPWQLLHGLGRATVLSGQGASRGLAEHWGCLKYCQALGGHPNDDRALALSKEGHAPAPRYKAVQSEELGIAFAIALATRVLQRRFPQHTFTVIDADIALNAGWVLGGRGRGRRDRDVAQLRPDYFIEARPQRGPSKVVVLECKGTHGAVSYACHQLGKAASQLESVRLQGRGRLPGLAIATELNAGLGIKLHVLDPDGDGTLDVPDDDAQSVNQAVPDRNIPPHFQVVDVEDGVERHRNISGFRIPEADRAWFRNLLARTTAAGLMAFAGARTAAAPYLTKRQGRDRYKDHVFAGTGSVQDAKHVVGGTLFLGTDQVFRIGGKRVEAFSGVAEPLFGRLVDGDVASYRSQAFDVFAQWREDAATTEHGWNGPVSIDPDGSIMALRKLPPR